jgi:hypothetical protein
VTQRERRRPHEGRGEPRHREEDRAPQAQGGDPGDGRRTDAREARPRALDRRPDRERARVPVWPRRGRQPEPGGGQRRPETQDPHERGGERQGPAAAIRVVDDVIENARSRRRGRRTRGGPWTHRNRPASGTRAASTVVIARTTGGTPSLRRRAPPPATPSARCWVELDGRTRRQYPAAQGRAPSAATTPVTAPCNVKAMIPTSTASATTTRIAIESSGAGR